jgi:hypothetical protein
LPLPSKEKSARAKLKNVKAIFLLGSALTRDAAGLRFGSDGSGGMPRRSRTDFSQRLLLQNLNNS